MSIQLFVNWEVESRFWKGMAVYLQAITPLIPAVMKPFLLPFVIAFSQGMKTGRLSFEFLYKFPFSGQFILNTFNMIYLLMQSYFPLIVNEIQNSPPILVPLGIGRPPDALRNFTRFGWTKQYQLANPTWRLSN